MFNLNSRPFLCVLIYPLGFPQPNHYGVFRTLAGAKKWGEKFKEKTQNTGGYVIFNPYHICYQYGRIKKQ